MIDGHVHAFPTLTESVADATERRLGPAAAGAVRDIVAPRVKRAWAQATRLMAPLLKGGPALTIEGVAKLTERSGCLHPALESAGTFAILPPVLLGGTLDGLFASMKRHGISKSVLIGSRGVASNEWLLGEAMTRGGERLVPVVTLPDLPAGSNESAWRLAYESLADAGARGFKIHTNWDDIDGDHPAVAAMFSVAAGRPSRAFIILHTGCFHVPSYKQKAAVNLESFEKHFRAHPAVRVCFAHMNREHPEAAWALMKRYPQLYADTSWQTSASIRRAVNAVGSDRIMVGSDWPLLHLELQQDARDRVVEAVQGAAQVDLLEASAKRFIGGDLTS